MNLKVWLITSTVSNVIVVSAMRKRSPIRMEIHSVPSQKYTDVSIGRELLVDFKAKETRHLVVKFEKPFPENIKTITIIGFNVHFRKEADYQSLNEDGKQIYLADDFQTMLEDRHQNEKSN